MPLTSLQDIPKKPEKKEPWTLKRLLSSPLGNTLTTVTKLFTNPFDALFGFLVLVLGVAELLGRRLSWIFWSITILVLLSDLLERHIDVLLARKSNQETKDDAK